jgi:hypothetical protein
MNPAQKPDFAVLQINRVTVQAGVQPSGCERWQAEACAPERLPKYFVNVQYRARLCSLAMYPEPVEGRRRTIWHCQLCRIEWSSH